MISAVTRAELGEDLVALALHRSADLVGVERLTRSAAPRRRAAAYRLRFADNRSLKGRRLRSPATARRVEEILRRLGHPAFPKPMQRKGCALLLEWIEGATLEHGRASLEHVRACGALHAWLHRFPWEATPALSPHTILSAHRVWAGRHLASCAKAGLVDDGEAETLAQLLETHRPLDCESGLVHGDLCGENLLVDRSGQLRVVDNEALSLGAYDADLARTWYRWPLSPSGREAYLRAYARHRSPDAFLTHFPYWAICALLGSLSHRRGAPAAVVAVPLDRLRNLTRGIEGRIAGPRLYREL